MIFTGIIEYNEILNFHQGSKSPKTAQMPLSALAVIL